MPNAAKATDAQHDALKRLEKKYGKVEKIGFDPIGRLEVILPLADEEPHRRRRAISPSGVVERVAP